MTSFNPNAEGWWGGKWRNGGKILLPQLNTHILEHAPRSIPVQVQASVKNGIDREIH